MSSKKVSKDSESIQHVFIIGSKGIPGRYGGFESFLENLTFYRDNKSIQYHVSCLSHNTKCFYHNNARCFNINVPNVGSAKAVYYDIAALRACIKYIKENSISKPVIYVLACRIGPFIAHYKKKIKSLDGKLYVNPDGHEWKRDKWNWLIKKYWKYSERLMVKHAELLICDSKNIEKYILKDYYKYNPVTKYIAYGAQINKSLLKHDDIKLTDWYKLKEVRPKEYYLVVGRFVPENNYETMIREFIKSDTKKDFVIITNVEKNKFYESLREKTEFDKDKRIKFVGTVYDAELLKKIRENAYAYFHGHEVGGTNPSLLEALASTELNLLLDVGFNREVAEDCALYWNKENRSLAGMINEAEHMGKVEIAIIGENAKKRVCECYSWEYIVSLYENVFYQDMNEGTK